LTRIPVVDFLLGLILVIAVALLQASLELVLLAGDNIKVIVGQLTPLLFDLTLDLLLVSFDAIPVHLFLL